MAAQDCPIICNIRKVGKVCVALLLCTLFSINNGSVLSQGHPTTMDSRGYARGRVLVRLSPSTLAARVQQERFTTDVASTIASQLSGSLARPLFPLDGQTAVQRQQTRASMEALSLLPVEIEAATRDRHNRFGLDRWIVLELSDGETVEEAVKRLCVLQLVEFVEPDYVGSGAGVRISEYVLPGFNPNDPRFDSQWYLDNVTDADIDMPEAWDIQRSASLVPVAVLDTGADLDHPDLAAGLLPGWDFVNDDSDPADDEGHGTNVTGLIGAIGGNSQGIAGVAFETFITPIKVLDDQQIGYYSWWASGLSYAADLGVRIINLSAGGVNHSESLLAAVQYAHSRDIVICTAMMNENSDVPYYPAAYSETIAVGATDRLDQRADPFVWGGGSSFASHIDLVAPGDGLISTYLNGTYAQYAGTSQATPLVAGVAALMMQIDVTLTPLEIATILTNTADDQVGRPAEDIDGFDRYHGHGRLNAAAALAAAEAGRDPPAAFSIYLPRPNPSSGPVRFVYDLDEPAIVWLRIFDVRGRLVATVLRGISRLPGTHIETWLGTGLDGNQVPSGVYLFELVAGSNRATGKLIRLIR
ncbi:S8 family serine peptidase [Gemmatimonadota bacterium]